MFSAQRHDGGYPHLQQLHGQVEVALDVGGVHDVDDGLWLLPQHEIPADQLLAGIGRHGVDAGQIGDGGVRLAADGAVLAVHRHAGEVAHVLVRASQLVEQRGLAAVLVAHQRKGQRLALGQGGAAALGMELAVLAQAQVGRLPVPPLPGGALGHVVDWRRLDLLRVRQPQRQLVAVDAQLHGVAHGSQLHQLCLGPGYHAHVQEVLAQRAFAAHRLDAGALAHLQIPQGHISRPVSVEHGFSYAPRPGFIPRRSVYSLYPLTNRVKLILFNFWVLAQAETKSRSSVPLRKLLRKGNRRTDFFGGMHKKNRPPVPFRILFQKGNRETALQIYSCRGGIAPPHNIPFT